MSFIDTQLNLLISVLLYDSFSLSDSSTTFSGLPHVIDHSHKTEEIDITSIRSTFAPSCCTHFAAALQQLHTYLWYRFLQQHLWFQLVAVGVSQLCTSFGSMCSGDGTVTFNHIAV